MNFNGMHGKKQWAHISADSARELAAQLTGAANRVDLSTPTSEWSAQLAATSETMARLAQTLAEAAATYSGAAE